VPRKKVGEHVRENAFEVGRRAHGKKNAEVCKGDALGIHDAASSDGQAHMYAANSNSLVCAS
jgi:hypothetical protein